MSKLIIESERVAAFCEGRQQKTTPYGILKASELLDVYYSKMAGLINEGMGLARGSWRDTPAATLLREAKEDPDFRDLYKAVFTLRDEKSWRNTSPYFIETTFIGVVLPAQVDCQSWEELMVKRQLLRNRSAAIYEPPRGHINSAYDPLRIYDEAMVARSTDR